MGISYCHVLSTTNVGCKVALLRQLVAKPLSGDFNDMLTLTSVDFQLDAQNSYSVTYNTFINTLRTRSFKLFKRPFPGLLTILTL